MTGPASRRGFLRGLTTLPMIGGGVALVGQPTAVAEPVTDALLTHYLGFVAREYRDLLVEIERRAAVRDIGEALAAGQPPRPDHVAACVGRAEERLSWLEHPGLVAKGRTLVDALPTARAALVLSAVGCDWREGGR